jgi:hypothetical protein
MNLKHIQTRQLSRRGASPGAQRFECLHRMQRTFNPYMVKQRLIVNSVRISLTHVRMQYHDISDRTRGPEGFRHRGCQLHHLRWERPIHRACCGFDHFVPLLCAILRHSQQEVPVLYLASYCPPVDRFEGLKNVLPVDGVACNVVSESAVRKRCSRERTGQVHFTCTRLSVGHPLALGQRAQLELTVPCMQQNDVSRFY